MAFGDNGKRKKTPFEMITMVVIVIMLIVTVGAILQPQLVLFHIKTHTEIKEIIYL